MPDVAIRSKNVSNILEFHLKTVVFKDADCHGHKWPRNQHVLTHHYKRKCAII